MASTYTAAAICFRMFSCCLSIRECDTTHPARGLAASGDRARGWSRRRCGNAARFRARPGAPRGRQRWKSCGSRPGSRWAGPIRHRRGAWTFLEVSLKEPGRYLLDEVAGCDDPGGGVVLAEIPGVAGDDVVGRGRLGAFIEAVV